VSTVNVNGKAAPARILVVDDEPSIVDAVATALRYEGFDIREAGTGRGAMSALVEFEPDLIVLDWMLPDVEGIEVGRRLRERGFKTAILFLTAKDTVENKVEALLLNPRRVLSKGQILQNVWRYDFGGTSSVVETYVSYLRKKLDVHGPPLIKTVRQAGYMLELEA
jgi:two-component system OmpR family response regulator